MTYKRLLSLIAVILFAITGAFPQHRVRELTVNGGCDYYGEPLDSKVYTFESDAAAVEAVDRILKPTGLVRNFDIRAADVPNAQAVIIPGDSTRYILYSQGFMRRLKAVTRTDWAAISIMAHEIGHHLNGHTLMPGGSRPPIELEADSFSGFVLYKMGASLEQAQSAMNAISSESGSSTHPPKRSRLAAIEAGWTKAQDQDRFKSRTAPTEPRTPPESEAIVITVDARRMWTNSSIRVNTGDVLTIEASGQVNGDVNDPNASGHKWVGPDGWGYDISNDLDNSYRLTFPLGKGSSFMCLIGRIGNENPFMIGSKYGFTSTVSGTLYLGINDSTTDLYGRPNGGLYFTDNAGSFTVRVTIKSSVR